MDLHRHNIKELCIPVTTVATRSALRSAARGDLVPRTRLAGANSATGHSSSLVQLMRGTVCLWTSELRRDHLHLRTCLNTSVFLDVQYVVTVSNPRVVV